MCLDKFWSVKPFWILNLRRVITFSIFFCRTFATLYKNLCLRQTPLIKERFLFAEIFFVYETFRWSIKIHLQEPFLFLENIYDREKFPYCRKVLLLWKSSWPVENVESLQRQIHKGKFTFLTAEKNNRSNNFESKC